MMPLSRVFLWAIVLYLLYGFVFNFLVPLFRTTRQVRKQFKNMQDAAMRDQMNGEAPGNPFQQQSAPTQKKADPTPGKNTMGEYIDFEEIK